MGPLGPKEEVPALCSNSPLLYKSCIASVLFLNDKGHQRFPKSLVVLEMRK